MLCTKLYINLANAFHHARDLGYHDQVMPPLKDLNSELVGLREESSLTKKGMHLKG